jgi:hypothetical protein
MSHATTVPLQQQRVYAASVIKDYTSMAAIVTHLMSKGMVCILSNTG